MKKIFLLLCTCGFSTQLFANDASMQQLLEVTNLIQFSENLLLSEQRNLEQFSKEIRHFSCLSNKGKQTALQEIKALQIQMQQNASSLKESIQIVMQKHLNYKLTQEEIINILSLMNTREGQQVTESLKKNNTDIINTPGTLDQNSFLPKNTHQQAFDALSKITSQQAKQAILLDIGKEGYGKKIEERVKKLQNIFMKEGCAID